MISITLKTGLPAYDAAPNYNKLTGQSKTTANATLYFERDKLCARVSAAKRSGFLTGYPGSNDNSEGGAHGSTLQLLCQQQGQQNLKVTLEGINLSDEYTDACIVADRVNDYRHTSRDISLGVRWTY